MVVKETPGVTNRDERNEEFRKKWNEDMTEDERWTYTQELRATQAGQDRKIRELNEDLKATRERLGNITDATDKNRAAESEETKQLLDDLAEFRAQKALIRRQSETLQKAAEARVPLDIALKFAELDDATEIVDRLEQVISERSNQLTNERLAASDPHMTLGDNGGGVISWADILAMSESERRRLPQQIIDKAIERAG